MDGLGDDTHRADSKTYTEFQDHKAGVRDDREVSGLHFHPVGFRLSGILVHVHSLMVACDTENRFRKRPAPACQCPVFPYTFSGSKTLSLKVFPSMVRKKQLRYPVWQAAPVCSTS